MTGSLRSLRRKITDARDLSSVVRSMKVLAATSVGQYEDAVHALDDYYRTVALALAVCLRQTGPIDSMRTDNRAAAQPIGTIIFGSDQGLVGRFNEALVEFAVRELGPARISAGTTWAVGERVHSLLIDNIQPRPRLLGVPATIQAITTLIDHILVEIEASREHEAVGAVHLFYNQLETGATYRPVTTRLLPLDQAWYRKMATRAWPTSRIPEVLEIDHSTLPALIRSYLFVLLFQACAESLASENASRLAAMQRAEKNIEDVLEQLNRRLRALRQQLIDDELFDVIAGYVAQSQGRP